MHTADIFTSMSFKVVQDILSVFVEENLNIVYRIMTKNN